jgi:malate dehydrogenase (oxaloacetate-decarboxylating)(NADP+)
MGARPENFVLFDIKGAISRERTDLEEFQVPFANAKLDDTLDKALTGADVLIGLSIGNVVTQDMIRSMAKNPIVFAMANPDPEISWPEAVAVRNDIIMATGRSDFPNQVNNVLGFPYIFRGALDVRATQINEAMKLAAVKALAELAQSPVPDIVNLAYNTGTITFGPNYIIPKPLDPRLLATVAPAVARAAIDSGVAQHPITDWETYVNDLNRRIGLDNQVMRVLGSKARRDPKRIVFAEADNVKILKAAQIVIDEGFGYPILLGNETRINAIAKENGINIEGLPIFDPRSPAMEAKRNAYSQIFFQKRQRKGFNYYESKKTIRDRNYFGSLMVEMGDADAMISGLTKNYPDTYSSRIASNRHGRKCKEDCRHAPHAHQERSAIHGRHYG